MAIYLGNMKVSGNGGSSSDNHRVMSQSEYQALEKIDQDTVYMISDDYDIGSIDGQVLSAIKMTVNKISSDTTVTYNNLTGTTQTKLNKISNDTYNIYTELTSTASGKIKNYLTGISTNGTSIYNYLTGTTQPEIGNINSSIDTINTNVNTLVENLIYTTYSEFVDFESFCFWTLGTDNHWLSTGTYYMALCDMQFLFPGCVYHTYNNVNNASEYSAPTSFRIGSEKLSSVLAGHYEGDALFKINVKSGQKFIFGCGTSAVQKAVHFYTIPFNASYTGFNCISAAS